jgi:hypothetical protein
MLALLITSGLDQRSISVGRAAATRLLFAVMRQETVAGRVPPPIPQLVERKQKLKPNCCKPSLYPVLILRLQT